MLGKQAVVTDGNEEDVITNAAIGRMPGSAVVIDAGHQRPDVPTTPAAAAQQQRRVTDRPSCPGPSEPHWEVPSGAGTVALRCLGCSAGVELIHHRLAPLRRCRVARCDPDMHRTGGKNFSKTAGPQMTKSVLKPRKPDLESKSRSGESFADLLEGSWAGTW